MNFKLKRNRKKLIKLLFITFIGILVLYLIVYLILHFLPNQLVKNRADNPIEISISEVKSVATKNLNKKVSSLKELVETALEGEKGIYGIAIKNLNTGETYYFNEHKSFEAVSLYKLWIMATVYEQIQNGELTEDQVLSEYATTLNQLFNIDPAYAEQVEEIITFTVYDALDQMITVSDNYAALLLIEKIKLSSATTFLKENSFNESAMGTDIKPPTSTPYDIALFLEKLYRGNLANEKYTNEMVNLLKNQQFNDGLSKYLPNKTEVAHKTGELDLLEHDAGIVFTNNGDYIIVIMSISDSPTDSKETIALISKSVFDYFTKKL